MTAEAQLIDQLNHLSAVADTTSVSELKRRVVGINTARMQIQWRDCLRPRNLAIHLGVYLLNRAIKSDIKESVIVMVSKEICIHRCPTDIDPQRLSSEASQSLLDDTLRRLTDLANRDNILLVAQTVTDSMAEVRLQSHLVSSASSATASTGISP